MTHNKLSPYVPFWVEMVNGKPSNPCRETLVEPKLTPPIHGNEVTEPLVGKFVSYNVGNPVAVAIGRGRRVEEHCSSSVGNETPVLHGSMRKLMNSQQINLGQRVIDLEDLGEVIHNLVAVVQSKASLLLQTTGSVNPDRNVLAIVLALGVRLDVFKVTNSPRQEVGRHDR